MADVSEQRGESASQSGESASELPTADVADQSGVLAKSPDQSDDTSDPARRADAVDDQPSRRARFCTRLSNGLKANYGRTPRWLAAFTVLSWSVGGLLFNSFAVCKNETIAKVAGSSNSIEQTVTHTCNQPTVTDAGVVAVAFLLVLLLIPDMSEIGVFGISLKRRIIAAEEKAEESKSKADRLETQVQIQNLRLESLSQSNAIATAQANGNAIYIGDDFIRSLETNFPGKAEAYKMGVDPEQKEAAVESSFDADDRLVTRLIRNWETIAASLDLPPYRRRKSEIHRIAISSDEAKRFVDIFYDELEVVRATRNSVAHAIPVSHNELRTAVAISDRLMEVLRGAQG